MSKNNLGKEIIQENIDVLISQKFGDYSKYIIQERALPDLRDGLKPVQRRILYAMHDLKLTHKTAYKKSARVVGDVIGKYHPHGDSSVYEAMVRLAQEWKINMPLVDMHGNKGSIDGDSPAAMRYTEARLGPISAYLLGDIDKKITDFVPNFDDSEEEPVVLPAKFPNLLVNGSMGIASGYSTNIPPHNFNEVIKAFIYVLKNEHATLSKITNYIKGPDFPTGGIVQDLDGLKQSYRTGKGKIIIKSRWNYDRRNKEILITEIPYETNKADLVRKIDELIHQNRVPGIKEVRDDTDRSGLQITLLCKPEVDVDLVMKFLLKTTDLQKNFNFNMVAIKDKKPTQVGLMDILVAFKSFRILTTRKLYTFELQKLQTRLEIVIGLIKVARIIDQVIDVIKTSKNKADAKANIIDKFSFTNLQAEAIVNMRLYHLTTTDVAALEEELHQLNLTIAHYNRALENKDYLIAQLVDELTKLGKEFNVPRKTTIDDEIENLDIDETALIQKEDVMVVVSHQGYIKKVSLRSREASAAETVGCREDDLIVAATKTSNLNSLVVFTSSGRYYSIPIYKLTDFKWKDLGEHLSKFTTLNPTERILKVGMLKDFHKNGTLVVATAKGLIKQTKISDLSIVLTRRGAKYAGIKKGDHVVSITLNLYEKAFVTTITKSGQALYYPLANVPISGLGASGVKNITLTAPDYVVSSIVNSEADVKSQKAQVLIVTSNGKAKRIRINELKKAARGSKGSKIAPQTKSSPYEIINAFNVSSVNDLQILTMTNNHIESYPKLSISITTPKTGLNGLIKEKIKLVFNDLRLQFERLRPKEPTREQTLNFKL